MPELSALPARESRYVDRGFYDRLVADNRRWSTAAPPVDDRLRPECESFLFAEARLLDEGRFEDWLDLYEDECAYWIQ